MRLRLCVLAMAAAALLALFVQPASASTVVTNWQMNETGGSTMVDSAGTNNGTLQNIVPNGSYYTFNGVNSLTTATQNFTIGDANISFTAKIRFGQVPNATVGDYDIVRGAPAGNWKLEIVRRNNGTTAKANCHFSGTSGGTQLAAGPSLADNNWHVITCTKTANSITLVVDGTAYTKSFTAGAINTTGKEITLGGQAISADQFQGDMDYVIVSVG